MPPRRIALRVSRPDSGPLGTRWTTKGFVPGLLLACATGVGLAQTSTRDLCVQPAGGPQGARIAVPISISEGGGVAAFQLDARFDTALLSLAGVRLGPDTAAAGGWILDHQVLEPGLVRILGYTFPSAGMTPGFKHVALMDFDVVAQEPIDGVPFPLSRCVLGDVGGGPIACGICVQPGVDGADPRFAISEVDDGFTFRPARITIEQGDWVLWRHIGLSRTHTSSSGAGCVTNGIWRGSLAPGGQFARRFLEPGGSLRPYFSEPDCAFGMTGEITVSDTIQLSLSEDLGDALLTWGGGIGRYLVHRSDAPAFVMHGTTSLTPDGGTAGTMFTDSGQPPLGQSLFYLVTNLP